MTLSAKNTFIISLLLTSGHFLSITLLPFLPLSLLTTILLCLLYSFWLGRRFFSHHTLLQGTLCFISAMTVLYTLIYYVYQLPFWLIIGLFYLLPCIVYTLCKKTDLTFSLSFEKPSITQTILLVLYGISIATLSVFLSGYEITGSVRSPWNVIPNTFFVLYATSSALLLFLLWGQKQAMHWWSILSVIVHTLFTFGIALMVYPIGFGYDPFVHQVTQQHIAEFGSILPKPFYYVGQYSLVVWISHITQLSIVFVDKLLILLFGVVLPIPTMTKSLKPFVSKSVLAITTIFLLAIPFEIFTFTTPQHLSYGIAALIAFLSLLYIKKETPFWLLLLLNLFQLAVHPLSGIPTAVFLWLLFLQTHSFRFKNTLYLFSVILASHVMLWVFGAQQWLTGNLSTAVSLSTLLELSSYTQLITIPIFYFTNTYHVVLDLVYFYGQNVTFWIFMTSFLGMYVMYRKTQWEHFSLMLMPFILIANFAIVSITLSFDALIIYEQGDFAQRLLTLAWIFALPFFFLFIASTLRFLRTRLSHTQIPLLLILFATLFSASVYIHYPRDDDFHTDRGYNVSQADLDAAQFIAKDTLGSYIVLSSQSTATGALSLYGFAHYFDDIFYYPIPTGGILYSHYLDMVYKPQNMQSAIEDVFALHEDIQTIYFVVNHYWWREEKIVAIAQEHFPEIHRLADDEITVFKISRSQ